MSTLTDRSAASGVRDLPSEFIELLPQHFERLRAGSAELAHLRTERLRRLVSVAVERSPFYRARLGGVVPSRMTPEDLSTVPPMTKTDLMDEFAEVVTDRRVTLGSLESHLAECGTAPSLFDGRFVVMSTGGSSGRRGVFVSDLDAAAEQMAAVVRGGLADVASRSGWPPPGPVPTAIVAAPTCVHATRCLSSLFLQGGVADITYAPVTEPFERIVEAVAAARPALLIGYPSIVARLADAQSSGRMAIQPMSVIVTSEQLTAAHTSSIVRGFGTQPINSYGTTEGLMGGAPPGSDVFDFASDLAIVEFVDADDRPVVTGEPAHHILITNLVNTVQPLIRYRIEDVMIEVDPSPQHGHQRARLTGRDDGPLVVGGATIHPLTLRSALGRHAAVADYRVTTGTEGVDIDVVAAGTPIDPRAIEATVRRALEQAGAREFAVTVRPIDHVPRDRLTGKVRRFVDVAGHRIAAD